MSVANAPQKGKVAGDGHIDTFTFTFAITKPDDVRLYKQDATDGVTPGTIRLIASNYTVTPNPKNSTGEIVGGIVRYPNTGDKLAEGENLVITRAVTPDQQLSLKTVGQFDAKVQEAEFDKITMILQDHAEQIARSLKYTIDQSPIDTDIAGFAATVISQSVGTAIRRGTFASLDAAALNDPFLAIIIGDPQVIGLFLGDRTIGDNGWAFLGGF